MKRAWGGGLQGVTEDGKRGPRRRRARKERERMSGPGAAGSRRGPLERLDGEEEVGLPLGCCGDRGVSWVAGSFVPERDPGSRGMQEGRRFRSRSVVLCLGTARGRGVASAGFCLQPGAGSAQGSCGEVGRGSGRGKSGRAARVVPMTGPRAPSLGGTYLRPGGPRAAASLRVTRSSTLALPPPSVQALVPLHVPGSGPGVLSP